MYFILAEQRDARKLALTRLFLFHFMICTHSTNMVHLQLPVGRKRGPGAALLFPVLRVSRPAHQVGRYRKGQSRGNVKTPSWSLFPECQGSYSLHWERVLAQVEAAFQGSPYLHGLLVLRGTNPSATTPIGLHPQNTTSRPNYTENFLAWQRVLKRGALQ